MATASDGAEMGLPPDILSARIRNELEMCRRTLRHRFETESWAEGTFPVVIGVTLVKTPGPVMRSGKVAHAYEHSLKIVVTSEYPYEKPIVRWQSPIFHPNIMLARDGGYVCTKLLDDWSFSSNLSSFVKGLESLLMNPNPSSPYASESCMTAASHFAEHRYAPPVVVSEASPPRVLG
jgi:ubiquitin-conjugating enzyme E2 C